MGRGTQVTRAHDVGERAHTVDMRACGGVGARCWGVAGACYLWLESGVLYTAQPHHSHHALASAFNKLAHVRPMRTHRNVSSHPPPNYNYNAMIHKQTCLCQSAASGTATTSVT